MKDFDKDDDDKKKQEKSKKVSCLIEADVRNSLKVTIFFSFRKALQTSNCF